MRKAADEAREKIRGVLEGGRQAVQESRTALRKAVEAGRGVLQRSPEKVEASAPIA